MSSVYTPTAVQLGNITIATDLDSRNAASVTGPMQAIADGVKYVDSGLAAEIATRGAGDATETAARNTILVPLADLTALAAITTPADGTVRHVLGFGFYTFKTSATTGLSPFRVAAADATTGGWVASNAHETTKDAFAHLSDAAVRISTNAGSPAATALSANQNFGPPTATETLGNGAGVQMQVVNTSTSNWHLFVPMNDLLVDGATLASATLYCRPRGTGATHAGLPTRQIQMIVVRNTMTGASGSGAPSFPNPVHLQSGGGSGFVALAAGTVAAYEADQTLTYTCDQNNVIDKSQYSYGAIIADEGGTNALAGSLFNQIKLSMTGITDARR